MQKLHIVICGNYGATNLGDEAILDGMLALIRRAVPLADVTVMSASPHDTMAFHGAGSVALIPAGLRSLVRGVFGGELGRTLRTLKSADVFILGGGGLFTDEKLYAVFIWWLQAYVARKCGAELVCLGQSVGPLRTWMGQRLTAWVYGRAAVATVRDERSRALLTELGAGGALGIEGKGDLGLGVLADPAFALSFLPPVTGALEREPYVVMSVRAWIGKGREKNARTLASFIDWLWREKGLKTVLVPFQVRGDNDVEVLEEIAEEIFDTRAVEIFSYTSDYRAIMELMARATATVGMRLHSLIFSTLASTPFIGISYSDKVREFMRSVEMEDFGVEWSNFGLRDLQERFEELLARREGLVTKIQEKALLMRAKAEQHVQVLEEMLK